MPIEILPGPFADVRGNLVVETIPFDAAIDKPLRWVFSDPGTMRPARIVKDIDLSVLALYPEANSTNFIAYIDADASGSYTPGEPFGYSVPAASSPRGAGQTFAINLTDTSAITPRIRLWGTDGLTNASDRSVWTGTDWTTKFPITMVIDHDRIPTNAYDRLNRLSAAPAEKVNVKVVRHIVDDFMNYRVHVQATVVMEKAFEHTSRDFLHEGDFLADGELDIDWKDLYNEVLQSEYVLDAGCKVTNVSYLVTFNFGPTAFTSDTDSTQVYAFSTLVTRRFEKTRTVPTPVGAYTTQTNTVFSWKIDNEDSWASFFGTTYTSFKVVVSNETTEVFNSGIRRLPARDQNGVYTFSTPQPLNPSTSQPLSWRVAVYNAKFKTDTLMTIRNNELVTGDPFSPPEPIGDEPPPELNPTGTVDIAIYPGPNASRRGPIIIEQERNPHRYRTPQKWTIPDCRLRRPPVITHRVTCSDTNTPFIAYIDTDGSGSYTPGEPFGYSVPAASSPRGAGQTFAINLTDTSAITPRIRLWGTDGLTNASDRSVLTGTDWTTKFPITMELMGKDSQGRPIPIRVNTNAYDRLNHLAAAPSEKVNVKVVRHTVDDFMTYRAGAPATVVMEKTFEQNARDFLHEGDFLSDGELDLDWSTLFNEVVTASGVLRSGCEVTNVSYLVTFNWGPTAFRTDSDTNTVVSAFSTLVTRRFEKTRTVPTPVSAYTTPTNTIFSFRIDNEDRWSSWFGTTYTAFKIVASNGSTEVLNSGILRLPARDQNGVYTFSTSQPLNPSTSQPLTWRVAVYNAKFKTDTLMAIYTEGDPFSPAQPITTP